MSYPFLSRIYVYPIKSLDPQEVKHSRITPKGSLLHDREFALFTEDGKPLSAKKEKRLHLIRSFVDFDNESFTFRYGGREERFSFSELEKVGEFFSEILG
ncbi:MAG: hypothetical protein GXO04_05395, partial [Aquificae bacterium]|nr:hypothetical protein [Aquificota bacterium]